MMLERAGRGEDDGDVGVELRLVPRHQLTGGRTFHRVRPAVATGGQQRLLQIKRLAGEIAAVLMTSTVGFDARSMTR